MFFAFLKPKSIADFVQRETGISHRPEAHCVQGVNHLLLLICTAHRYPVQRLLPPHECRSRNLTLDACQHTNEHNIASNARCLHRFRQCARPSGFDDEIDTATPCPFHNLRRPVLMQAIIHSEIRSDRPCTFQFFIGRRCHDDSRASTLGKLECENRYAASAKYQYISVWLEFVHDLDCTPCGQAGGWESRSFHEIPILGHARKKVCRSDDHFSCIAIDTIARRSSESRTRRIAPLPIGKEGRHDVVSERK